MAASAVADIVVTVILAIVTAGAGAAANIAAKSGRLVKVAKLLEKIAATLKRVGPKAKLLEKGHDAAGAAAKVEKRASKAARNKGVPNIDSPKSSKKLEKKAPKEYDTLDKNAGPKKTSKAVPKKEFADITKANEWGKKHYKGWVDNLSVSEREAVTEYTGTRYKNINAVLRGKESSYTGRNAEFAENVSSALKKADVPEDVVVYRGASKGAL
jgi:hypothetical protein